MCHVVGAHVGHDFQAGRIGQGLSVTQLDGQSYFRPVQDRLAVKTDDDLTLSGNAVLVAEPVDRIGMPAGDLSFDCRQLSGP